MAFRQTEIAEDTVVFTDIKESKNGSVFVLEILARDTECWVCPDRTDCEYAFDFCDDSRMCLLTE